MHGEIKELPSAVDHVFVDFENVHTIDRNIFDARTVHLTLLMGSRQTRLDMTLVETLLQHAVTVEFVRLKTSGRNALDFTLAYYVGRAVLANPSGCFHILSKDAGYDPLIEHLRSKNVWIKRHDNCTTLTSPSSAIVALSQPVTKPKSLPVHKAQQHSAGADTDEKESKVLEHLRKPTIPRPRTKRKLLNFLVAHFNKGVTEAEALNLIVKLSQAGHLVIDDVGKVTYRLAPCETPTGHQG